MDCSARCLFQRNVGFPGMGTSKSGVCSVMADMIGEERKERDDRRCEKRAKRFRR